MAIYASGLSFKMTCVVYHPTVTVLVRHLVGAYQVWIQPLMQWIEDMIMYYCPNVEIIQWQRWYKVPLLGNICLSPLRLVNRTVIVCATTVLVSDPSLIDS